MQTDTNLMQRQSDLIKAMRFPLIVLVMFAHSLTLPENPGGGGWGIYYFVTEMISHNLAKIAVCWFFVFSGYFFFLKFDGNRMESKWVLEKWRNRVRTLLLPYLIWNLLAILAIMIKSWLCVKVGLGEDEQMAWVREGDVLSWLWGSRANFPLWYMRDLMILSLFAPMLFYLLKNAKTGLIVVGIIYLIASFFSVPLDRSICFFSLGAYLGIHKKNILQICRSIEVPSAIAAILTLILASVGNNWQCHHLLLKIFYPFGMITFMNIFDAVINNAGIKQFLIRLSNSVFFIYAAHEIYILQWTKGFCLRTLGNGLLGMSISYVIVPIAVIVICVCLKDICNKVAPKALAFICGGRVNRRK